MKKRISNRAKYGSNLRAAIVICLLCCMVAATAFTLNKDKNVKVVNKTSASLIKKDSVTSVKAFAQVYTVLTSARCMNCHPSGDIPLQGDDSHLHKNVASAWQRWQGHLRYEMC